MTNTSTHMKLTYEDYVSNHNDWKRHELIGGETYVTPAPLTKRQRISVNLVVALHDHHQRTNVSRVFSAPTDVKFIETNG